MTIDEAIAKYNKLANNDRTCYREEAQQLAEWLEELKMYKSLTPRELVSEKQKNDRAIEYSKGFDCGFKEGYNNAVDDFLERIQWEYLNGCEIKQSEIEFLIYVSSQIAERLKAGAK